MKIRLFCMIALVLSVAACTDPVSYARKAGAFQNVPGVDGNPVHLLKNS